MGIRYDSADAEAFQAARQVSSNGLAGWREAIARHLAPCPGMRLLDLGAGTGMWATAFAECKHAGHDEKDNQIETVANNNRRRAQCASIDM